MSVLSSITGSLPNVLNLLQGKWDVQYKTKDGTALANENSWLNIKGLDLSILNRLNSLPNIINQNTWKSLDFDSFLDIQEIDDTTITHNPVEGSSFRSVNKVSKPKQVKVTIAKSGIGYGIEDSIAEVKKLLPLARNMNQNPSFPLEFRICTPFDLISNLNLTKMDYTFKKDNGRNMLILYLTFEEIRSVEKSIESIRVTSPSNIGNVIIGRLSGLKG